MLTKQQFAQVINHTPLVSLDLLVENTRGEFLLGLRNNRPARGCWFVPGGRIFKGESLAKAFERLTLTELGRAIPLRQARHHGLYEHFYSDNVFADEQDYADISTHYVVNAFQLTLPAGFDLPSQQHSEWRWLTAQQILLDEQVHTHTKWYFQ